jgi:DNA-binding NtrC family response regulator
MNEAPTILVVDDNADLLDTFAMILKRRGFNVETAVNGANAVDKFKEHDFDVTLMDIVMPEMNGVEAFRKIREVDPGAPVILMTAYSDDDLLQTARDEGADHVVNKPIRIDQLIELIKEAAASQPILVVDDDTDICHTLTRALEMEGYEVLAANSGEDAVGIVSETPCQMAFIDIKLPDIDGLETFLRLKELNPGIRTVMMTGFRNEVRDVLEKAEAASAITCLYKPFDPGVLTELVRQTKGKPRKAKKYD